MSDAKRLDGLGVIVTRPRAAAEQLRAALTGAGARVLVFPALEIEESAPSPALQSLLGELERFDLAIFVSANAVEKGLAAVRRFGAWPASLEVAAIGEATAQALRNSGFATAISPPERHDSEALASLERLQAVGGEEIVIFRGEGGREHLKNVLEERGARVAYAECYRRVRPRSDPSPVVDALARGDVHAVSALSAETLENFVAMIGPQAAARLGTLALLVPHETVGASREARRFGRIVVAAHGSAGLIEALAQLRVTT